MRAMTLVTPIMISLAVLAVGCQKRSPTSSASGPSASVSKAMETFGEQPYTVCDLGSQSVHSDLKFQGEHLKLADEVTIKGAGSALTVRLGAHELTATPSEDGSELRGEATFEHQQKVAEGGVSPETAATPIMLPHQVRITKSAHYEAPVAPAHGCDPEKKIIDIEFCPKADDGTWQCRLPGANHQGDVHAQP